MHDYVILPMAVATDVPGLRATIDASLAHTLALPPKEPKPAKAKATGSSKVAMPGTGGKA